MGLGRVLATCSALILMLGSTAARAHLVIDRVDTGQWLTAGKIVLFADHFDGREIEKALSSDMLFFFDGDSVRGAVDVTTFEEANQQIGVAVLIAANRSYVSELDPEGGNKTRIIDLENEGSARFFARLGPQSRVSAFYYDEDGVRQVAPWSNDPRALAQRLRDGAPARGGGGGQLAPSLYDGIERVLTSFEEDISMPERKVLVVMSDGSDRTVAVALERKIEALVDAAMSPEVDVHIYSIGFTFGQPGPLVDLGTLAVKTGGIALEVAFERYPEIPDRLTAIADGLMNQHVITFTPEDYVGSDKPVDIRVEGHLFKAQVAGIELETRELCDGYVGPKLVLLIGGVLVGIAVVGVTILVIRSRRARSGARALPHPG